MAEWSNISVSDFARGIHARTGENKIPEGFVESLINMDAIGQQLRKRTGYEGFAGALPHRVDSLVYTAANDEIKLTFDGIVDLSSTGSSPLVVYGRTNLSANGGDFTTIDSCQYYDSFVPQARDTLVAGSGTLTKTPAQRPIEDTIYITQMAESLSLLNTSWEAVFPNAEKQIQANNNLDLDYTVASDTDVFVFYKGKTASSGTVYVNDTLAIDGNGEASITLAQHQLNNFNITAQFYRDSSSVWERIYPDSLKINQSTGTVDIAFGTLASTTVRVILTAIDVTNTLTDSLTTNSTTVVRLPSPETPWVFFSCYIDDGVEYEQIFPNSVVYNSSTNELEIELYNGGPSVPVTIFYEYGDIAANSLTITSHTPISSDGSDSYPQLTVWGLGHEAPIYGGSKEAREGWVTHLDSYRNVGEDRLVAALGGSIYSSRSRHEAGQTYCMPSLFPSLRARTATSDTTISPLFHTTGASPGRSVGWVEADNILNNEAVIDSITYNNSTGYVDIELSTPNAAYYDGTGIPTTIDTTIVKGIDTVCIRGTEHPRHSGTFTIEDVAAPDVDRVILSISNPQVNSSVWDEYDVGGRAGVFTDTIITSSPSFFLPGDILDSTAFAAPLSVVGISGTNLYVAGVNSTQIIEANVRITGSRTSSVIPLRDSAGVRGVEYFVNYDTVVYTDVDNNFNITRINAQGDDAVTLTDDGTTLTIDGVSDSRQFAAGQTIILAQAGMYSGEHIILGAPTVTSLAVASVETGTGSGTLLGYTIELDSALSWEDSAANDVHVVVPYRWIPLEAPDSRQSLPKATHTYYLPSGNVAEKPFVRSTMVGGNMYFTTGDDAVLKFDGTNVYRAGLFRWQPEAFLMQDTGHSGGLIPVTTNTSGTVSAVSGSRFTVPISDMSKFVIGERVEHSQDGGRYTIVTIEPDNSTTPATNMFIKVDREISGSASGTLSTINTYSYYFRLNMFDANSNIIASAVTGSEDYRIELAADAAVKGRLIGFPALDTYHYDRIELEIYRNYSNDLTEYRRVLVMPVSFENGEGYVDFIDTLADEDWNAQPLDPVSSALLGAELGTTWTEPLRAKYVSSSDNKLILGNVKSWPRLDIQIVNDREEISSTDLAGSVWYFKRQNTLSNANTNMVEHVKYEWVDTGDVTIDPDPGGDDAISTTDDTFTITSTSHGLSVGDWIYAFHSSLKSSSIPTFCGWWQIAVVPDANSFTINFSGHGRGTSGGDVDDIDRYVTATNPKDIPVWIGVDGNRDYISGNTSLPKLDAVSRLSQAINASMRLTDVSISGQESFEPWITANAGGGYSAGQMIVEQPKRDTTLAAGEAFELDLPNFSGYKVFVNSVNRAPSVSVQAIELLFPSRLLISYTNYPELFDAPTATLPSQSDSVIDVNPSDGQEITGIIPFFGESSFGDSSKSGVMVVFKTNSIYLVDVNRKAQGAANGVANPVQKIDSRGLGCTAPYSIAYTRNGIMFANESGIYRLTQNLTVDYTGDKMERRWQEDVRKDMLSIAMGHHAARDNKYKLSLPIGRDALHNSEVYVYNHAQEVQIGEGAWSRYDSHLATGWANLGSEAFYGSINGRVFRVRSRGLQSDFRDDNAPYKATAILRAEDFGIPGVRKAVSKVLLDLRIPYSFSNTTIGWATDMNKSFQPLPSFRAESGTRSVGKFRFDLSEARGTTFQVKVENNGLDEPLEICGIDYSVTALSAQGTKRASEFTG